MSDDLRKLAEAATPGPWNPWHDSEGWFVRSDGHGHHIASVDHDIDAYHDCEPFWHNEENARFIAAANPTAILALLDRLAAVEAERDAARADRARVVAWLRGNGHDLAADEIERGAHWEAEP